MPVRVGDRVENGLHLLQLWKRHQERAEEVLVLYPADGYWRARPLPPQHLRWSAYGSSFLIGPIETTGRPIVDIREIVFDPAAKAFRLSFVRGGQGALSLKELDQDKIVLDVSIDPVVGAAQPFAGLRSMYVMDGNADVAQIGVARAGRAELDAEPVMDFKRAERVELWAGRTLPSRHNTSAPDTIFRDFK